MNGSSNGMIAIPEGWFLEGDERRRTFVRPFEIDRCLVTNREYAQFVEATGAPPPPHWVGGLCPGDGADHPVVNITWHEATAYADWAGKRLPQGREWEKAARGEDGRKYPWGDAFDPSRCNTLESGLSGTSPVGAYEAGASPFGVLDMSGNVWEWALDKAPQLKTFRMARAGSWYFPQKFARSACVNWLSPEYRFPDVGIRCVRSEFVPHAS